MLNKKLRSINLDKRITRKILRVIKSSKNSLTVQSILLPNGMESISK